MKYEWRNYPTQKPDKSGYYYTVHVLDGQRWYKAIWWDCEKDSWIHWRPAPWRAGISPDVLAFVLESMNEYYCPCVSGVAENVERYSAYDE